MRCVIVGWFLCVARRATGFSSLKATSQAGGLQWTALHGASFSATTTTEVIELSDGRTMQVELSLPRKKSNKPLLLFMHGSFHGAWCWTEKWFDYFRDFPKLAVNWRGTGGTPAKEGVKKVPIQMHVSDLKDVLAYLKEKRYDKIVAVSHSFGGLCVMKLLEEQNPFQGIVMMCSVPPSGNGKMTIRFLRRSLVASYRITMGFALKKCLQSTDLCRILFFGGKPEAVNGEIDDHGISDEDVLRYQSYFARDSVATIDLLDLAKQLPSTQADDSGRAVFLDDTPCLVLGGTDDYIVDEEGNFETAKFFGTEPVYVDSPHDLMLGSKAQNGAGALEEWLEKHF